MWWVPRTHTTLSSPPTPKVTVYKYLRIVVLELANLNLCIMVACALWWIIDSCHGDRYYLSCSVTPCLLGAHLDSKDVYQLSDVIKESGSILYSII